MHGKNVQHVLQRSQSLHGLAFGELKDISVLLYDPLVIASCGNAVKMDPLDLPGGICPIGMGLITVDTAELIFIQMKMLSGISQITGTGPDIEQQKAVIAGTLYVVGAVTKKMSQTDRI